MWASQRSRRGTKLLSWCAGLSHESQKACKQSPDRSRKGIKSCHSESCGSPVSDVRNRDSPRTLFPDTTIGSLSDSIPGFRNSGAAVQSLPRYGCSRCKISGFRWVNVVHFFTLRKIVKDMRKPGTKPKNICFFLPKENWTDKGCSCRFSWLRYMIDPSLPPAF